MAVEPKAGSIPVETAQPSMIDIIEAIAQSWDGCECDVFTVGMVDIGDAIRREGVKLANKVPALDAENMALRQLLCDVLASLGTGAGADPKCSMEFLSGIPEEVRMTVNKMRALIAQHEAQQAAWDDKPDEWSAAIEAAHPIRSKAHDAYATAMKMVGNRRSKGALVDLVCWLLQQHDARREARREVQKPIGYGQSDHLQKIGPHGAFLCRITGEPTMDFKPLYLHPAQPRKVRMLTQQELDATYSNWLLTDAHTKYTWAEWQFREFTRINNLEIEE